MIKENHCVANDAILIEQFDDITDNEWEKDSMKEWINDLIIEGYIIEPSLTIYDPDTKAIIVTMIHKGYLQ